MEIASASAIHVETSKVPVRGIVIGILAICQSTKLLRFMSKYDYVIVRFMSKYQVSAIHVDICVRGIVIVVFIEMYII